MNYRLPAGRFYGSLPYRRQLPGFTLTESIDSPALRLPRHCHERAYCCFVLKGAYTEQYEKKLRDCSPGTLVFHPSWEEQAEQFHENGGRLFRVEIEPARLSTIREHSSLSQSAAHFRGGRLAYLAGHLYREFREEDAASLLAMEGLILEIIAVATRSSTHAPAQPPHWLVRAHELLHDRFSENLSLETIADLVAVHPVHLARSFRRFYHATIGECVRRVRIEFASQQLAGTDKCLAEIALAAGFADQSHFTRTFKRLTGVTPASYRLVYRGAKVGPAR
jgi:AraC family transcriptional regulator